MTGATGEESISNADRNATNESMEVEEGMYVCV